MIETLEGKSYNFSQQEVRNAYWRGVKAGQIRIDASGQPIHPTDTTKAAVTPYFIGVMWDTMTAQVINHILRDVITMRAVCETEKTTLIVCFDKENETLQKLLRAMDVMWIREIKNATYFRSYYSGEPLDAPEWATKVDQIQIFPDKAEPTGMTYPSQFSKDLKMDDLQYVSDTMFRLKTPPKGPADWGSQAPW